MTPKITTQSLLAWLNAQRDAVNEKIVAASPQEEGRYKQDLQTINAIAERVGEMTAVEFCEKRTRMCEFYMKENAGRGVGACAGCPLDDADPPCGMLVEEDPRRAVEVVKRWKEDAE